MKSLLKAAALFVTSSLFFTSCKNEDKRKEDITAETKEFKLKEETVTYKVDSLTMNSYVAYDENQEGARPAILVIHEWWGLNDYAKMRARKLAELGYIAMAVDMYGNGQVGNDPASAEKLAMPFYVDPSKAKKHFDSAYANFKKNRLVDPSKMAVIGYCFGGAVAIGTARLGADVVGAVSFHGNLNVVPANKDLLKAEILVCHGGADPMVPQSEVDQFKKQMDSIGAKYTIRVYDSATHAFTNPEATAIGEKFKIPVRYNPTADSASWADMKAFFDRIFK
jgi:dienelactone hydrolase